MTYVTMLSLANAFLRAALNSIQSRLSEHSFYRIDHLSDIYDYSVNAEDAVDELEVTLNDTFDTFQFELTASDYCRLFRVEKEDLKARTDIYLNTDTVYVTLASFSSELAEDIRSELFSRCKIHSSFSYIIDTRL